jgi:hypothetical protein
MIAKIIARKIGLNPSSNGQLTKTALEAGGLAARWLAMRLLGLRPERVANGLSRGGTTAGYRGNFDTPINHRALEHRRGTLPPRLFRYFRHDANM